MTTPAITTDFQTYVDNLEVATLQLRDEVAGSSSGTDYFTITHAHRNQARYNQPLPSGGNTKQGDTIWQFPISESATTIPLGSTLTDTNGEVWTILSINKQIWSSKWEAICRNLAIDANLTTLSSIEQATYAKHSSSGEASATWTPVYTNVRSRFQPSIDTLEVAENADQTTRRGQFILATSLSFMPDASYRLIDASSNVYRILSYHQASRIDSLPYLEVELDPDA